MSTISDKLYGAGFAFGELRAEVIKVEGARLVAITVPRDVLREIGVHLSSRGFAHANIKVCEDTIQIECGEEYSFHFDGKLPSLPQQVLSTEAATARSADALNRSLLDFYMGVEQMKRDFALQLPKYLKSQLDCVDVRVSWAPSWLTNRNSRVVATDMGHVYKVFLSEGIDLANLRNEVRDSLKSNVAAELVSRTEAVRIAKSFGLDL